MNTMTSAQRVQAALAGEHVDRVPFCFWHHFKPEGSGERLAEMTFEFFRQKFELDIEMIAAVAQTKGRRLILANGCSIPDDTPEKWLYMARQLVDKLR